MSSILGLSGYEKEVFAVIFNFWIAAGETSVPASLTVIQKITGGSRPAIIRALHNLKRKAYLNIEKKNGKNSLYTIIIDTQVLSDFKKSYKHHPTTDWNSYTNNAHLKNEVCSGGLPEAK